MSKRIYLSLALMSGHEMQFIQEAFNTNWVVPLGPNVDGFEVDLKKYLDTNKEPVALVSGTSALHLALLQAGVGPGDEVLCQSFTFAASANPITYLGAQPVFIGSEPDTWNMDPILLEEAIRDRMIKTGKTPKAVVPVHLYGMPAKMDEINEVANKYGVVVIEDAAEALGSNYKNQKCGSLADFGVLSFNGNKIITTSGGGALVCSNQETAAKTKFYATQARDDAPHYQHSEIGYNYRLSNICAGIGRGQMIALESFVERRREINALYRELLQDVPGIEFQTEPAADFISNYWLTTVRIDPGMCGFNREDIRLALEAENIETRPLWKPMHMQPVFDHVPRYTNKVEEDLFENGLCLPSGAALTNEDIARIVDSIKKQIK